MLTLSFLQQLETIVENLSDWTEDPRVSRQIVHDVAMAALEAAQDAPAGLITIDQLRAIVSTKFGNGQCQPREYHLVRTVTR